MRWERRGSNAIHPLWGEVLDLKNHIPALHFGKATGFEGWQILVHLSINVFTPPLPSTATTTVLYMSLQKVGACWWVDYDRLRMRLLLLSEDQIVAEIVSIYVAEWSKHSSQPVFSLCFFVFFSPKSLTIYTMVHNETRKKIGMVPTHSSTCKVLFKEQGYLKKHNGIWGMNSQDGRLAFEFQWLPLCRFLGSFAGIPAVSFQALAYPHLGGVFSTYLPTDYWPLMTQSNPEKVFTVQSAAHTFPCEVCILVLEKERMRTSPSKFILSMIFYSFNSEIFFKVVLTSLF